MCAPGAIAVPHPSGVLSTPNAWLGRMRGNSIRCNFHTVHTPHTIGSGTRRVHRTITGLCSGQGRRLGEHRPGTLSARL